MRSDSGNSGFECRPHPLSGVTSGAALGVVLVSMSGSSAGMPPSVPPAAKLRHAHAASCGELFRGPVAWVTDSTAVTAAAFRSVVDCTAIVKSLHVGALAEDAAGGRVTMQGARLVACNHAIENNAVGLASATSPCLHTR